MASKESDDCDLVRSKRQTTPSPRQHEKRPWIERQAGEAARGSDGLLAKVSTAEDKGRTSAEFSEPVRPLRVLLVEDTPASQRLVAFILSKRGHRVEAASDGCQAVEMVRREDFDVLLMDVQMPVMNGFQATEAIRKIHGGTKARIPIIGMTANAREGDADRCLAAGMDAWIAKPITRQEDLVETVERFGLTGDDRSIAVRSWPRNPGQRLPKSPSLRKSAQPATNFPDHDEAPAEAAPQPPWPSMEASNGEDQPSPVPLAVFDLEKAVRCCFGDYDFFRQMVGFFFQEAGPLLEAMQTATTRGDSEAVSRAAHRLSNTLMYLGATPATDASKRLESFARSGSLQEAAKELEELARRLERLTEALTPHAAQKDALNSTQSGG